MNSTQIKEASVTELQARLTRISNRAVRNEQKAALLSGIDSSIALSLRGSKLGRVKADLAEKALLEQQLKSLTTKA